MAKHSLEWEDPPPSPPETCSPSDLEWHPLEPENVRATVRKLQKCLSEQTSTPPIIPTVLKTETALCATIKKRPSPSSEEDVPEDMDSPWGSIVYKERVCTVDDKKYLYEDDCNMDSPWGSLVYSTARTKKRKGKSHSPFPRKQKRRLIWKSLLKFLQWHFDVHMTEIT